MRLASAIGVGAALAGIACSVPDAAAQAAGFATMAPVEQYLMDRDAEIRLARSAAPESISRDATVLVLGRQGVCDRRVADSVEIHRRPDHSHGSLSDTSAWLQVSPMA